MIESHLVEGRQDYVPGTPSVYGQSITDACLSFEQTLPVFEELATAQQRRRGVVQPQPAPSTRSTVVDTRKNA
jgi:3-deoxy-7-phosphoheptulonate synthase